jgi:hypothetical protein
MSSYNKNRIRVLYKCHEPLPPCPTIKSVWITIGPGKPHCVAIQAALAAEIFTEMNINDNIGQSAAHVVFARLSIALGL